jgi:hypothetical protein
MNSSILHITNGDSTTKYLQKLNLSGEFITWREMLCEGKTVTDVGSESFWKTRFDFLKDSYKISKKIFVEYTLKEYRNLCNKKNSEEIILWFEYDLFCQINMIAVISWLKRYRKEYPISLVCSGNIKDSKKKLGLSELSKSQIDQHYKNRIHLTQDDIEYADYIWQLYCSDSPLRLEAVYKFNPMSPFKYLATALEAHLTRFPSIENGLNSVENFILKTSNDYHPATNKELVEQLLKNQETFGFGDTQYYKKLEMLQSLFLTTKTAQLNIKGKKVLKNQLNYYGKLRNEVSFLGGVKKYSFLYYNKTQKLLKITS